MLHFIRRSLLTKFLLLLSIMGIVAGIGLSVLIYYEKITQSIDYTLDVTVTQMMLAKRIQFSAQEIAEGRTEYRQIMQADIQEYDSYLEAFTNGGTNGKQLTPSSEEIRAYITANNRLWDEYKPKAILIATSEINVQEPHSEHGEEGFHLEDEHQERSSDSNDSEFQEALAYIQQKTDELIAINNKIRQGYLTFASNHWQLANQMTATFVSTNVVMFGLAFWYTRKFIHPIKSLKTTMESVKSGQYEVKAKITTADEVGSLAETFNSMVGTIRSKTRELEDKNKVLTETSGHLITLTAQLREQADKLREVDLAKEEFASMITHELKTPLTPIQGYCELLLRGALGDLTKEQKETIQVIYESALSLSKLTQDVLDIHKLELGKTKFNMYDTSAKELIVRSINRFKPIAEAKNIQLVDGVDNDTKLTGDPERILQVLNNLASNAIKFVPEHEGKVEIYARRVNGSVLFTVKDNGIGIPKEKQQNLFKKFYQVDTSIQRKSGGAGLGLAISRGIVEAHNGKIWVESEEGKGTTFYFTIPVGGWKQ